MSRPSVGMLILISLLAGCSQEQITGLDPQPPEAGPRALIRATAVNGKIAFTRNVEENYDIWVMNPDGTAQTNITNNAAYDDEAAWSPDGTRIAFTSERDGNGEIYVMNADGSGPTRLTNHAAYDYNAAWSPDGTRIAFASVRDGNTEIYVMNADGSGQTNLTNNIVYDDQPAWSPDGTQIAFKRVAEIYVMNADGSGPINLTNHAAEESNPAWSPDGTQIAFSTSRHGNGEIYVMNADGSGQTNLTNNAFHDDEPAWSPDGTRIAFAMDRDDIYVMNADGSGQTNVTNNAAGHFQPSWGTAPATEVCDGADNDLDGQTDEGFTNTDGDGLADCVDPDDDNDGILDSVDSAPLVASAHFSDVGLGGATAGTITLPANTAVAVRDTTPGGVKVVVTATGTVAGSARVEIQLDGKKSNIRLAIPGTYVVTDPVDDVTVEVVVAGPAEIELLLNGSPIVIAIAEGASATVTETTDANGDLTGVTVSNVTGDSGSVAVNGTTVPPGDTWSPSAGPTSKEECKKGGWKAFGFVNEGQCLQSFTSGKPGKRT